MYCPRCRIEFPGNRCSHCGTEVGALGENSREEPISKSSQESIRFSFASQTSVDHESETPDWRLELKRKLSEHTEKKQGQARARGSESRKQDVSDQRVAHSTSERPLFDYKLIEVGRKETRRKVVTSAAKGSVPRRVTEKPVVRTPVSSGRASQSPAPKQGALTLQMPSPPTASLSVSKAEDTSPEEIKISHEIILSRLLAGIIDFSFPLLIAFVFTFSASKILHFDFLSASSMRLSLVLSGCFFFLNSFFFLVLNGQTPGMYLTDLRLVGEESENVSLQSVLLRICLFLPAVATLVGLLWGVFDPWCRCAHDRLSKTRIVPLNFRVLSRIDRPEVANGGGTGIPHLDL